MPDAATFAFIKIVVRDVDRVRVFYEKVLGLERAQTLDGETFIEEMLRTPGAEGPPQLVLYYSKSNPPITVGDGWGPVGFYVKDVKATYDLALAEGGGLVREPFRHGDLMVAFVSDPEGHQVELIGPAPR